MEDRVLQYLTEVWYETYYIRQCKFPWQGSRSLFQIRQKSAPKYFTLNYVIDPTLPSSALFIFVNVRVPWSSSQDTIVQVVASEPDGHAAMASFGIMKDGNGYQDQSRNQRDITTQIVISVALGFFAFLAFCFLRPRWTTLYAARKRQKNAASILPELPDTFFGWIPALYRVTEDQVLASAGLDAFVVSIQNRSWILNH